MKLVDDKEEIEGEAARTDCFLCRPSGLLLADVSSEGFAVAGLGPLCDGYTVVATCHHLRGLAEAAPSYRDRFAQYVARLADTLKKRYGACFLVEHGNTEICGISPADRPHSFHPHILLIPDARCSVLPFQDYFGAPGTRFASLSEAIAGAADKGAYLFVGPVDGPLFTFESLSESPRQLARGLIAEQLGVVGRASWRDDPGLEWSLSNAVELRETLGRTK